MAKQIIILENNASEGGLSALRVAFWLAAVSGQEVPLPQLAQSSWKLASSDEIAALQTGAVIEEVRNFTFPTSIGTDDIHKILQIAYQDRVEYLASIPPKGQFYGIFFDGSSWSVTKG